MKQNYLTLKLEEARRAQIKKSAEDVATIAKATDVDLQNPDAGLGLKERINDLEIAICELLYAIS